MFIKTYYRMRLEIYKEFGFILMYYLPKAFALHQQGKLHKTSSRLGTDSLFFFSSEHVELDKHDDSLFPEQFACYSHNRPAFTSNTWTPPNLNEFYKNDEFKFDKPILTIHNKNSMEWQRGIFNYFDADALRNLLSEFSEDFQIIYIKPFYNGANITKDGLQKTVEIGDAYVLNEFSNVITIEELYKSGSYSSYNELQFKILANSDHHIAPAGDCVIPAYFSGDVLIYNHPNCNSTNRGCLGKLILG